MPRLAPDPAATRAPARAGHDDRMPMAASSADLTLVAALRQGDEAAFASLVERYHPSLVRVAALYVSNHQVAQEVAQDTWLGVLRGIDRFQGQCSLKTWIFRILANRARTRAARERRTIPLSALWGTGAGTPERSVEPERFRPADHPTQPGGWAAPPRSWDGLPEEQALSRELRARIQEAIDALPIGQRTVLTLRDVEGWRAPDVCALLGISESNQRVLLHRARSRVRRALEQYVGERRTRSVA